MMDFNRSVLEQAVEILDYAKEARKEGIKPYVQTKVTEDLQSYQEKLREADGVFLRQLLVAIPISGLYAAQYSRQAHRFCRLARLFEQCCSGHCALTETCEAYNRAKDAEDTSPGYRHFKRAGSMLELMRNGLRIASYSASENNLANSSSIPVEGEQRRLAAHDSVEGTLLPSAEYLRRRSRYEWNCPADYLKEHYTEHQLRSVVVEKLTLPFQRFTASRKPIYKDVASQNSETLLPFLSCDCVNAVWQSLLATGRIHHRGIQSYRELYDMATWGESTELATPWTAQGDYTYVDPMSLAQGLLGDDYKLGVIFEGDLNTIVWLLGKACREDEREVIIYCRGFPHDPAYQGVKLLNVGQIPMRPPRVDHAFSDIGNFWTWAKRRETQWHLGPFEPGFLTSIKAIAQQSLPCWKPFPFLRLPPKLRKRVYEEYLSYRDRRLDWTRPLSGRLHIDVPELCQTGRQLLTEVFPLYLERRPFELAVARRRSITLGTQPLLHQFLKFKEVDLDLRDRGCIIMLRLRSDVRGFTIDHRGPMQQHEPKILARLDELKVLIQILVEDMTTEGLTPEDLAAVNEFLFFSRHTRRSL